jgi:hypothetical protein
VIKTWKCNNSKTDNCKFTCCTEVNFMVMHSFILASCLLYLLCYSCLCDVLILTCFLFNCQLTDVGFVKRVCVCVCARARERVYMYVYVNLENAAAGSSEMSVTIRLHGVTFQKTAPLKKNLKSYVCEKYIFYFHVDYYLNLKFFSTIFLCFMKRKYLYGMRFCTI